MAGSYSPEYNRLRSYFPSEAAWNYYMEAPVTSYIRSIGLPANRSLKESQEMLAEARQGLADGSTLQGRVKTLENQVESHREALAAFLEDIPYTLEFLQLELSRAQKEREGQGENAQLKARIQHIRTIQEALRTFGVGLPNNLY